jgi:hypothetical protein
MRVRSATKASRWFDQEPQLALAPIQTRRRQIRFAEVGAGDRERVDRVGLPKRPSSPTHVRHQLRRHPNNPLPRSQQVTLEPP